MNGIDSIGSLSARYMERADPLLEAAKDLETAFLAEMLKSSGLGQTPGTFGGGAGEDQFVSFLRTAQAEAMVEAGGIGLAQSLYESLLKGQPDDA